MAKSKPKTQAGKPAAGKPAAAKPEEDKPVAGKPPAGKTPLGKQARRELARKKAKRNRMIAITVVSAVLLIAATLITYTVIQNSLAEVYTDGEQTVSLRPNGRFRAELAHENYRGSYKKTEEDGATVVTLTYGKASVVAHLYDDQMELPEEWNDDHGHGDVLTKK